MKRITTADRRVHFVRPDGLPLCGRDDSPRDLFGQPVASAPLHRQTDDPVTCPHCATLYCQIKNAPWNTVDDASLYTATFSAVGANAPDHYLEEQSAAAHTVDAFG